MDMPENPRICVLSSGLDRIHKPCSDMLKSQILFPGVPIDFYGLFWNGWDGEKMNDHTRGFRSNTIWTAPQRVFEGFEEVRKPPETNVQNFLSMVWGRWLLNQQMTLNNLWDQYDIFLYCRPDVCFGNRLYLPNVLRDLGEHDLFTPHNGHWRDGMNDQVCFGGRKLSIYLTLFEDVSKYMAEGMEIHPESLLKHHLTQHGVRVAAFPINNFIFRDEARFHLG